jgi:glycosyltransferase involved in cell wall biosynthesis
MKRMLGLVIAWPPQVLSSSEGLARLLSFLIRGGIESGAKVMIVCPEWSRKELYHLLKDAEIPIAKDRIEILSTGQIPPVLTLHSMFLRWASKPRRTSFMERFFFWSGERVSDIIVWIAGTSSWIVLTIAIIAGILVSPIIIIVGILYVVMKTILKYAYKNRMPKIEKKVKSVSQPLQAFRSDLFARRIFDAINERELTKLAELARTQTSVNSWLIPTPFWPNLVKQLPRKVVVCPDSVISEFPVGFEIDVFGSRMVERRGLIKESLDAANHLITYSNYVKTTHLEDKFAIPDEKISVIPHGYLTLENSLNILKPFKMLSPREQDDFCLQIVHEYLRASASDPYLRNFNFSGVRFLLYTSQVRPSKNIRTLIRAFHRLLHNKHEPLKLILTCNPNEDPLSMQLVSTLGLERDVLFLTNIPTRVMAALYHLSVVAVNPTMFEGGFPFTFSEAYSVGTPSIMSRIPVVEEYITDPHLQDTMLFDPYNVDEMVDRILWALHNRQELFNIQQPVYNQLQNRSWSQVAQEYMDVLDHIETST